MNAVEPNSLHERLRQHIGDIKKENQSYYRGVGCGIVREPIPEYIQASCEKVISNSNNAWIVLGRDRPTSRFSGYGGKGDMKCGMVDIVVGRLSANPQSVDETERRLYADPNFKTDAARVYISQKADIDQYMNLVAGTVGNRKEKSAIGMKADDLRFVARRGIKLVTGTDEKDSRGAPVASTFGIDLLANNDDSDIQPFVKGENAKFALDKMIDYMDNLSGIVDSLLTQQMKFNSELTHHYHVSPFYGKSTSPSLSVTSSGIQTNLKLLKDTKMSLVKFKTNLSMFRANYLLPSGSKYINSRYNNTN